MAAIPPPPPPPPEPPGGFRQPAQHARPPMPTAQAHPQHQPHMAGQQAPLGHQRPMPGGPPPMAANMPAQRQHGAAGRPNAQQHPANFPKSYHGWTFRKIPAASLSAGVEPSWQKVTRTPMPFSSESLALQVRRQNESRKKGKTVYDDMLAIKSRYQHAAIDRLREEKQGEEENPHAEWVLVYVVNDMRQVARKHRFEMESKELRVIMCRQKKSGVVVGASGDGGEVKSNGLPGEIIDFEEPYERPAPEAERTSMGQIPMMTQSQHHRGAVGSTMQGATMDGGARPGGGFPHAGGPGGGPGGQPGRPSGPVGPAGGPQPMQPRQGQGPPMGGMGHGGQHQMGQGPGPGPQGQQPHLPPRMNTPSPGQEGMHQPAMGQLAMGHHQMGQPGMGRHGMAQQGMGQQPMRQPDMDGSGVGQHQTEQPGMGQRNMGNMGSQHQQKAGKLKNKVAGGNMNNGGGANIGRGPAPFPQQAGHLNNYDDDEDPEEVDGIVGTGSKMGKRKAPPVFEPIQGFKQSKPVREKEPMMMPREEPMPREEQRLRREPSNLNRNSKNININIVPPHMEGIMSNLSMQDRGWDDERRRPKRGSRRGSPTSSSGSSSFDSIFDTEPVRYSRPGGMSPSISPATSPEPDRRRMPLRDGLSTPRDYPRRDLVNEFGSREKAYDYGVNLDFGMEPHQRRRHGGFADELYDGYSNGDVMLEREYRYGDGGFDDYPYPPGQGPDRMGRARQPRSPPRRFVEVPMPPEQYPWMSADDDGRYRQDAVRMSQLRRTSRGQRRMDSSDDDWNRPQERRRREDYGQTVGRGRRGGTKREGRMGRMGGGYY